MVWMSLASAATVTVDAQHDVHGVVTVSAPIDTIRPLFADPIWIAEVDGGGTLITQTGMEGACGLYDNVSPSAIKTLRYATKVCSTESGYRAELVSSDSFDVYVATWTFEPADKGTIIRYDLAMSTSLMVPQFMMDRAAKRGVMKLLLNLEARFGTP